MADHKKDEIELKTVKSTPQKKKEEEQGIPAYMSELVLSETIKKRIVREFLLEKDVMTKERDAEGLPPLWEELDALYEGDIEEDEDRQFNLHKPTVKVKVDEVSGAIVEAFLDSDPIYSVVPRPEHAKTHGDDAACEKKQDFLDYKLDMVIPMRPVMYQVAHSATLKGTGIKKIFHRIRRQKRKREEIYEGKEGLSLFQRNYPNKEDVKGSYDSYIKQLTAGKRIRIMGSYTETTYNDPMPTFVDLKNFITRIGTKGYEGLKEAYLTVEIQEYTWWELKKLEEEPNGFYDIDKLKYKGKENEEDKDDGPKAMKGFENKTYVVFECVGHAVITNKKNDTETVKIVMWIAEDREVSIGSILYPYYAVDCYYNPHYIKIKNDGFYQPGIAKYMKDRNIAEDALLNFGLEGVWARNMITPIVEDGSEIESQFLEKRWGHGIPLNAKPGEVDFLNKYMGSFDSRSILGMLEYLVRDDDDDSGVSSLITGGESEIDPNAPGNKTMALLRVSGKNIKRYIQCMLPAFNRTADIILQLYYQMSTEGREYRIKPERVVGDNPFAVLERDEMAAKTNIQARAMSFSFDKLNEKREDLALLATIRGEALIARRPQSVYIILKHVIKNWSPKWKNLVDEILPSIEQMQKEEMTVVLQALKLFIGAQVQQAKETKQPLALPLEPLMQLVSQARTALTNPTPEEQEAQKK